jgi:hypothetical protein
MTLTPIDPRKSAEPLRDRLGSSGSQPLLELLMIDDARLLSHQPSSVKDGEIGNATHVVSRRQLRVTLGIDLQHYRLPRQVRRGPRYFRSGHAARSAPCRPEIDQHGHPRLADDLIERFRIGLDWLVRRR